MFINTLPVRVRVDPGEPLVPWLQALAGAAGGAAPVRVHPSRPAARLDRPAPPGAPLREHRRLENYPVGGPPGREQPGGERRQRGRGADQLPPQPGRRAGGAPGPKLLYDPARYAPQTAERLLGHLRALLEGMAAAFRRGAWATCPCCRPPSAGRSSGLERHGVLYPRDATVHQLVAAQAGAGAAGRRRGGRGRDPDLRRPGGAGQPPGAAPPGPGY